jgi:hypothetical protein
LKADIRAPRLPRFSQQVQVRGILVIDGEDDIRLTLRDRPLYEIAVLLMPSQAIRPSDLKDVMHATTGQITNFADVSVGTIFQQQSGLEVLRQFDCVIDTSSPKQMNIVYKYQYLRHM